MLVNCAGLLVLRIGLTVLLDMGQAISIGGYYQMVVDRYEMVVDYYYCWAVRLKFVQPKVMAVVKS